MPYDVSPRSRCGPRRLESGGPTGVVLALVIGFLAGSDPVMALADSPDQTARQRPMTVSGAGVFDLSEAGSRSPNLPAQGWLVAQAPLFRPEGGRPSEAPVAPDRFRPDSRFGPAPERNPNAASEPGVDARDRRLRRDDRFRPLPERRPKYEELYPPATDFPPLWPP